MESLLNWPPSRGPNPHEHAREYIPGAIVREDLQPKEGRKATEQTVLESLEGSNAEAVFLDCAPDDDKEFLLLLDCKPEPRRPLIGYWCLWYQVEDVAGLTLEQATKFVRVCRLKPDEAKWQGADGHLDDWCRYEPRALTVDICYPLSVGVRLTVPPMTIWRRPCPTCDEDAANKRTERAEMTVGYFLWMVAKEYERIYKEHERYGVWGHAIGDLGFEGVEVGEDGVVTLLMGS